jgi:hypothetical protein
LGEPSLDEVPGAKRPGSLIGTKKVGPPEKDETQQRAGQEGQREEKPSRGLGIFRLRALGRHGARVYGRRPSRPYFAAMSETPARPRLAVTIVARDEEDRLPATFASVAFADEVVVVVDAATTDRTAEVARAAGAHVIVRAFDGFGPQKNAAADVTTAPWILSVDADEIVLPELAAEITAVLAAAAADPEHSPVAYQVPIHLEFLGRVLRFGRDTVVTPTRLYRQGAARFSDAKVHEKVIARGPVGTLRAWIHHRSYRDLTHYLEKLDLYTTLGAEAKAAQHRHPPRLLLLRVVWEFLDRSVLHLGVLDGKAGLIFAALSSGHTLFKYLKLRTLVR